MCSSFLTNIFWSLTCTTIRVWNKFYCQIKNSIIKWALTLAHTCSTKYTFYVFFSLAHTCSTKYTFYIFFSLFSFMPFCISACWFLCFSVFFKLFLWLFICLVLSVCLYLFVSVFVLNCFRPFPKTALTDTTSTP